MNPQVWKIEFRGSETFPPVVLKNQIATESPTFLEKIKFWKNRGHPVDDIQIRKDVVRLKNFYNRRGFHAAEVSYELEDQDKAWKKKLIFDIDEDAPILIDRVNFTFEAKSNYRQYISDHKAFRKMQQKHPFQQGKRYQKILISEVVGQVRDVLRNLGFAYAEVNVEAKVDTSRLSAELNIICDTGPLTNISEVNVEGNKTISKPYVIRESGLNIGEQYGLDKMQEAQRELFNHHLYRFVTINIPKQEKDTTLNLQLRVREAPLRSLQASVGFGFEELARGQLSWTHRNVFGKAHRFTATGRASFIQQLVSFDYLFPYVFNTRSSFIVSPFAEHQLEKSFELFRAGLTNSIIYRYGKNGTISAAYEYTKNEELSSRRDVTLPDTALQYDLSSLQFSSYYSQGYGREQLGWVIQPYAEISGFMGLASFNFRKLSLDVRRFTELSSGTILATRLQSGGLFSAAEDSLPRNIRFFLGGTNSVRGWYRQNLGPKEASFRTEEVEQNGSVVERTVFDGYVPVGGRAFFGFNIELRQKWDSFIKGFGLTAFLDGGQVWKDLQNTGNRPIQFGVGGGVRYRSPIGPLRVDVGYKLNPTDKDLGIYQGSDYNRWDKIGIHFSLGQSF